MAMIRITGQGLGGIAVSVAVLWGCLLAEGVLVRQANHEVTRSLQTLHILKTRHSFPVSHPRPAATNPRAVRA